MTPCAYPVRGKRRVSGKICKFFNFSNFLNSSRPYLCICDAQAYEPLYIHMPTKGKNKGSKWNFCKKLRHAECLETLVFGIQSQIQFPYLSLPCKGDSMATPSKAEGGHQALFYAERCFRGGKSFFQGRKR